jgi:hypothetical protein
MSEKSACQTSDFDSAMKSYSNMDSAIFAYLNSIFIFLGSSFDILAKIVTELNQIDTINYTAYPNLKSKNILFGDNKNIPNSFINETIFERPEIVRKIESIRNRIVHNGSFDFGQIIYTGYIEKKNDYESCIMFPDIKDGNFVSFKNRRNFYSKSNRINLLLPEILKEILELIHSTIEKVNTTFVKNRYCNENDILIYKTDIENWSKSALKVFNVE